MTSSAEGTVRRVGGVVLVMEVVPRMGLEVGEAESSVGFGEFYEAEFAGACRLAHLLTGRGDVAEDLAQLALIQVHDRFDELRNPPAFLRTVLVNVCRNWQRGHVREQRRLSVWAPTTLEDDLPVEVSEVLAVVDRLPYRQRAVVVLRYWLDLSEADIAEHLGCRRGTVKSASARALATLREELG